MCRARAGQIMVANGLDGCQRRGTGDGIAAVGAAKAARVHRVQEIPRGR